MSRTIYALLALTSLTWWTRCLAESLDAKCELLGRRHVTEMRDKFHRDQTLLRVVSFYSSTLDSCIYTEVAEVGVSYEIRDLTYSVMRDGGMFNVLLKCDVDGADSVVVEKVRKYRGFVFSVPYSEWLDDGFGGPPRTLKAPTTPYTKEDCQRAFDKWMSYLKP